MERTEIAEKIRRSLRRKKIDGLIVFDRADARYISGFTGSSGAVFISPAGNYLLTDSRYTEQAGWECRGFLVKNSGGNLPRALKRIMRAGGLKVAGYNPDSLTYAQFQKMKEGIAPHGLAPAGGVIRRMRAVKSQREIALIRRACLAADNAMRAVRGIIRPGVAEGDLEAELFYYLRKKEGAGLAFPPVITSGRNTSLPHGAPSGKKIKMGDMVMVDFGAEIDGYRSDLTRTFCVGRMTPGQKSLYESVLSNQVESIEKLAPGVEAGRFFRFSRSGLRKAGWDLVHALGHGVGLDVHEAPVLSRGAGMKLRENMVFTVEPGVYLPGRWGVRIEDVVLLTNSGAEVLSKTTKRRISI